jgi:ATP adenylyltransferase
MLNAFPYNNGHLMVCPLRHSAEILSLDEAEALGLFRAVTEAKRLLDKTLKPEGYNIGLNISRAAGAGITGHLHIHIVPRWLGDSNFMPVVSGTKVVSQSLRELRKMLRHAYKKNA